MQYSANASRSVVVPVRSTVVYLHKKKGTAKNLQNPLERRRSKKRVVNIIGRFEQTRTNWRWKRRGKKTAYIWRQLWCSNKKHKKIPTHTQSAQTSNRTFRSTVSIQTNKGFYILTMSKPVVFKKIWSLSSFEWIVVQCNIIVLKFEILIVINFQTISTPWWRKQKKSPNLWN